MAHSTDMVLDFDHELDFSEILTNPILDIAARVWDNDRYSAFQVCYRSMRRLDDLVDDFKSEGKSGTDKRDAIALAIREFDSGLSLDSLGGSFGHDLLHTLQRFHIPGWPWHRLSRAMLYDLDHNSFPSFLVFLRYCEGAAIAPASVFMHLAGLRRGQANALTLPPYDIRLAARPLALFSYLVHIMRDFEKDQKAGLAYFADSIVTACDLRQSDLLQYAGAKSPDSRFRKLVLEYCRLAEHYRAKARQCIDSLKPSIGPRYQLSLELIYDLYLQLFQRITAADGSLEASEVNPSPDEVAARIDQAVADFRPV